MIKIWQEGSQYYMELRDPKRTKLEISLVEYEDINNSNIRINNKYKQIK